MAERRSAIKSIRQYCVETCCAGDQEYVRECPGNSLNISVSCPLWPYRMGKNPNISDETRTKRRELAKSRNFNPKTGRTQAMNMRKMDGNTEDETH